MKGKLSKEEPIIARLIGFCERGWGRDHTSILVFLRNTTTCSLFSALLIISRVCWSGQAARSDFFFIKKPLWSSALVLPWYRMHCPPSTSAIKCQLKFGNILTIARHSIRWIVSLITLLSIPLFSIYLHSTTSEGGKDNLSKIRRLEGQIKELREYYRELKEGYREGQCRWD